MKIQIEVIPQDGKIIVNTTTNEEIKYTELLGLIELAKHHILDSVCIKSLKEVNKT